MSLPVVDPSKLTPTREATVAGVVLAAGTSTRFGEANKLLAELEGEPVVRRAARTLLQSEVASVTVVVGYEADQVRTALKGLDVDIVENPDFADGQATSVRVGTDAIKERDVDAVLFALGDMPLVAVTSINEVIRAHRAGAGRILAAAASGQRGNPVLFDSKYVDQLAGVEGDRGARELLLESNDAALVETGDPGVLQDIDTVDDLEQVRD